MSINCRIGFIGEDAIVDRRNLSKPIGEVLPNWFSAKKGVTGFKGIAFTCWQEGTKCALADQDLLVEVDVLAPDLGEEVNRSGFVFG